MLSKSNARPMDDIIRVLLSYTFFAPSDRYSGFSCSDLDKFDDENRGSGSEGASQACEGGLGDCGGDEPRPATSDAGETGERNLDSDDRDVREREASSVGMLLTLSSSSSSSSLSESLTWVKHIRVMGGCCECGARVADGTDVRTRKSIIEGHIDVRMNIG